MGDSHHLQLSDKHIFLILESKLVIQYVLLNSQLTSTEVPFLITNEFFLAIQYRLVSWFASAYR